MIKTLITLVLIFLLPLVLTAGDEDGILRKGRNFANRGEYDSALECFNEAAQINPENTAVWLAMAVVYVNMKMNYEAIDCLNRVIAIDSRNATAYYILAMVYEETGDVFGSIDAWNRLLDISPRGGRSGIARQHLKRLEGN